MVESTALLFDKEMVLQPAQRALSAPPGGDEFKLAFIDCTIHTEAEVEEDPWFTYRKDGFNGILVPCDEAVQARMREHAVEKLSRALTENVDAIVFPEFALPPIDIENLGPDEEVFNPFDAQQQHMVDIQFEAAAAGILHDACERESANRSPEDVPFIFYGSMHCQQSRYNIGVVSPGKPYERQYVLVSERENPISTKRKTVEKSAPRSGPLVHKKRFPARRIGERARVPASPQFRMYPSKIGMIAVLICSDAIDQNQFWYIVRHNARAKPTKNFARIGLVIVPSYTHSDLLHTTCKDLSALANTTVFVGNASGTVARMNPDFTDRMPQSQLFQCGKNEDELLEAGQVTLRRERGIRHYSFAPANGR